MAPNVNLPDLRYGEGQRRERMLRVRSSISTPRFISGRPYSPRLFSSRFEGFGELEPVNLDDYQFIRAVNTLLRPSQSIEEALSTVMINVFLGFENGIVEPGKSYSRHEMGYIRSQTRSLLGDLSALELICGKDRVGSIAKFNQRDVYQFPKLKDLMQSDVFGQDNSGYHIMRIRNPAILDSMEIDEEEILEEIRSRPSYKDQIEEYAERMLDPKLEEIKELDMLIDDLITEQGDIEPGDFTGALERLQRYSDDHPDLSPGKRTYLDLGVDILNFANYLREETKKLASERKTLPDELDIITNVLGNVPVLILESSDIIEIPGYRLVAAYGEKTASPSALFQRVS